MPESATHAALAARLIALASDVQSGVTTPGEAVTALSDEFKLNPNSLRDYLTGTRAMLSGKTYQHRLSLRVSKLILDQIISRNGSTGATLAIDAVREHIAYYLSVNGTGQPALAAYCDELESRQVTHPPDIDQLDKLVLSSMRLPANMRKSMLSSSGHKPDHGFARVKVFNRNQHVIAEVLLRANGVCEQCGFPAPFKKASSGLPYLEVHHRVLLAEDGDDTVENAIALCPNCHRKLHFGLGS